MQATDPANTPARAEFKLGGFRRIITFRPNI